VKKDEKDMQRKKEMYQNVKIIGTFVILAIQGARGELLGVTTAVVLYAWWVE